MGEIPWRKAGSLKGGKQSQNICALGDWASHRKGSDGLKERRCPGKREEASAERRCLKWETAALFGKKNIPGGRHGPFNMHLLMAEQYTASQKGKTKPQAY